MKTKFIDEFGRAKAVQRYGKPQPMPTTKYGHSQVQQSLDQKFETNFPKSGKGKSPKGR